MDTSQPRISGNEFGIFAFGTDAEKRRILRDQKFPKAIKVNYYQPAASAILRSLKKGVFSKVDLVEAMNAIKSAPADTKHKARVRQNNATAVRRFLTIYEKAAPPNGVHTIIRRNATFEFEGIIVSVRPDILTENIDGKFFTYSKLRVSSNKYSLDASEILLLLIQKFAEVQSFEGLSFDVSRARLIDCFSQQIFEAHNVSTYKGQLLMKAAKEIHALWPFIKEN